MRVWCGLLLRLSPICTPLVSTLVTVTGGRCTGCPLRRSELGAELPVPVQSLYLQSWPTRLTGQLMGSRLALQGNSANDDSVIGLLLRVWIPSSLSHVEMHRNCRRNFILMLILNTFTTDGRVETIIVASHLRLGTAMDSLPPPAQLLTRRLENSDSILVRRPSLPVSDSVPKPDVLEHSTTV